MLYNIALRVFKNKTWIQNGGIKNDYRKSWNDIEYDISPTILNIFTIQTHMSIKYYKLWKT